MSKPGVLFVHNNFPGQFGFIATALRQAGEACVAIGSSTAKSTDIPTRRWSLTRGTTQGIFNLAIRAEADMMRGRAAAQCALDLKAKGFRPKLIIGHPGWGETLFLKEVFPEARQILHGEFFYRTRGGDTGFDPEFETLAFEEQCRVYAKNVTMALAYADADRIVAPTPFQRSLFPASLRPHVSVVHEGVDTDKVKPQPNASFTLADGRVLDRSTPVVTFINRNFEPLRGYHIFMRALPRILAEVPNAEVVLIGADSAHGYGGAAPGGATWKQRFLDEVKDRLDLSRVHFTGRVPYDKMLAALSISAAHVYYTYPFVLSWSLLEAMASECLIIGSDTAPVRDAVESGKNGLLSDFFDVDALSEAVIQACRRPADFAPLRQAARRTVVERFDRSRICLPAWLQVIREVQAQR